MCASETINCRIFSCRARPKVPGYEDVPMLRLLTMICLGGAYSLKDHEVFVGNRHESLRRWPERLLVMVKLIKITVPQQQHKTNIHTTHCILNHSYSSLIHQQQSEPKVLLTRVELVGNCVCLCILTFVRSPWVFFTQPLLYLVVQKVGHQRH